MVTIIMVWQRIPRSIHIDNNYAKIIIIFIANEQWTIPSISFLNKSICSIFKSYYTIYYSFFNRESVRFDNNKIITTAIIIMNNKQLLRIPNYFWLSPNAYFMHIFSIANVSWMQQKRKCLERTVLLSFKINRSITNTGSELIEV